MSRAVRQALKMNNPKMRAMMTSINGTAGSPAASGFDASQILSVTKNGTGDYTIIFKYKFNVNTECMAIPSSKTPGVQAVVAAVDHDRVTVESYDAATGATPTDADFDLLIIGNDNRLNY